MSLFSPLYGIISVYSVFAVRVEENVLVDPTTEAEHVRGGMFARLQHLEHHSESLLPVSRTVPPANIHTFKYKSPICEIPEKYG